MTENRVCDPWVLEKEREEQIRRETAASFGVSLWRYDELSLLHTNPSLLRTVVSIYPSGGITFEYNNKGGHNFGLPIKGK
jgi:hypothetical protein